MASISGGRPALAATPIVKSRRIKWRIIIARNFLYPSLLDIKGIFC